MRPARLVGLLVVVVACSHPAPPPAISHAPPPTPAPMPVPPPPPVDALPTIPSTPQPAPDDLLVTASVGEPLSTLAALGAYADAVQPGIGAMATPATAIQLAASRGLDLRGVDLTRPARALLLDPQAHPQPVLAVVAVADEHALRAQVAALGQELIIHDGWAAIGDRDLLRAAAPYALTTLVASPPPARPHVTIAVATVLARYHDQVQQFVERAIAAQPATFGTTMADSLRWYVALLDQLERLDVELAADGDRATVTLAMAARAGTAVAAFARQQQPGDFALLERMAPTALVAGGRLDTRAVFAGMMALSRPMMASMYGPQVADTAAALFTRWPELANGENAFTVAPVPGQIAVAALWDVTDGAAAQALWLEYLTTLGRSQPGMMATTVDTKAARYRGVRFALTRSTSTSPAMQQGMAIYGGHLDVGYAVAGPQFAMAMGADVIPTLRTLTDIAIPKRGARPRAVDPALAATIAVARAHRTSYLIAVDAPAVRAGFQRGAPAPTPHELAMLGVGFDGDSVVLRAVLPASQLAPLLR